MNILETLVQLRDDIKTWVTNNLSALNDKIDKNFIYVDKELSTTSTNPVQNKTITNAINNIPRFSGSYNDLTDAPNIAEDESGSMVIADESGNIIFKADADGIHTTAVSLNGEKAASEKFVENAIAAIDIPEVDFTGYATETYVDGKVADLVNSAPEALNTLGELATALETHEDAYGALLETMGSKATYTDLENLKEELSESIVSESNEWKVVDNDGNIIFSVDVEGVHTTELALNGEAVATEAYVDSAVASIEIPEVDFTGYATETYVTDAIANIEFPETDLTNYYTKSETDVAINAAKEEISEAIVAESTEWKVVDEAGNIIFSVDADGAHTTSLTLNGETVTNIIDTRVASLVDSAPDTLNTLNELAAALGDDPNFATTIAAEIGKKVDKVSGKGLSENDFTNEYKNILDNLGSMAFEESDPTVPDWAKSAEKPTYTKSEVGLGNVDNTSDINKPVSTATQAALNELKEELSESIVSESESWTLVDNSGNIVAKIDQNGLDVTSINTNAITINGLSLEDVIAAKVQEYIDTAILGGKW